MDVGVPQSCPLTYVEQFSGGKSTTNGDRAVEPIGGASPPRAREQVRTNEREQMSLEIGNHDDLSCDAREFPNESHCVWGLEVVQRRR